MSPEPVTLLRAAALRLTPQRQLVLETLGEAGGRHVTAEEVWRAVHARYPSFNLSTAYRVLDLLSSVGVVRQTRLGGSVVHYELGGEGGHHHLLCSRCRRVLDLPVDDLAGLRKRAYQRHGFHVGTGEVTILGECDDCFQGGPRVPAAPHATEPPGPVGGSGRSRSPRSGAGGRDGGQRAMPAGEGRAASGSGGRTKATSRASARERRRA